MRWSTASCFEGTRATGVDYIRDGVRRTARAGREVILAAGAIGSPLILQRSGVGPPEILQIARHRRRAGECRGRVQPAGSSVHRPRLPLARADAQRGAASAARQVCVPALTYLLWRRGPLSLSVNQGGGFVRSRPELARPNLQLYFSPVSYTRAPPGQTSADASRPVPRNPAQRATVPAYQPRLPACAIVQARRSACDRAKLAGRAAGSGGPAGGGAPCCAGSQPRRHCRP